MHANADFDDELGRLRLLEARYDPHTHRRLSMFGPLAGTRCLEVGAGAGSVARWLAARPDRQARSWPPTSTPGFSLTRRGPASTRERWARSPSACRSAATTYSRPARS